jgi:hypothetical protein
VLSYPLSLSSKRKRGRLLWLWYGDFAHCVCVNKCWNRQSRGKDRSNGTIRHSFVTHSSDIRSLDSCDQRTTTLRKRTLRRDGEQRKEKKKIEARPTRDELSRSIIIDVKGSDRKLQSWPSTISPKCVYCCRVHGRNMSLSMPADATCSLHSPT